MKSYRTGEKVGYGVYVAPRARDAKFVGSSGETLEGKADAEYLRIPTALLVVAGPLLGGLFVVAFPVLVALALVYALVQLLMRKTGHGSFAPIGPSRRPVWLALAAVILGGAFAAVVPMLIQHSAVNAIARYPRTEATSMHTMFDFVTHIKGIEYLVALAAIFVFLAFWEALKPRPFRTLKTAGHDDVEFVKEQGGARYFLKSVGRLVAAPFIAVGYVAMVPALFILAGVLGLAQLAYAGGARVFELFGAHVEEWKPMETWFPTARHA